MMSEGSLAWQFMSDTQRQLALDGQLLIEDRKRHPNEQLSDYSYLVFPFAKLYEGFLKALLWNLGIITEREHLSSHFRLGKVLSPNLIRRLKDHSAYAQISSRFGEDLAIELWDTWKQGRNLVFHYFPHNVRRLSIVDAQATIDLITRAMEHAADRMRPSIHGRK